MALFHQIPHQKCLSDRDWMSLKEIQSVLKPFSLAQRMSEGDKYVTLSLVCPVVCFLREEMRDLCQNLAIQE